MTKVHEYLAKLQRDSEFWHSRASMARKALRFAVIKQKSADICAELWEANQIVRTGHDFLFSVDDIDEKAIQFWDECVAFLEDQGLELTFQQKQGTAPDPTYCLGFQIWVHPNGQRVELFVLAEEPHAEFAVGVGTTGDTITTALKLAFPERLCRVL